jgi:hypothetical protein
MTLRKSKPKDRTLPAWLNPLAGPVVLDFVAPMPLEEAIQRLKAEDKSGFSLDYHVHVDLIAHDADTFGFVVTKSGRKYTTTAVRGLLKRWDEHTTQVTGEVNLAAHTYWLVPLLALVAMGIFFLLLPPEMAWFMVLFIGVMGIGWASTRGNRQEVAALVMIALKARPD